MNKFQFYLDVFEQGKTFAPLDDLVESVIGDAAQTGNGIAFGSRPTAASVAVIVACVVVAIIVRPRRFSGRRRARRSDGGGSTVAVLLGRTCSSVRLVAVPQMLHVHNFE